MFVVTGDDSRLRANSNVHLPAPLPGDAILAHRNETVKEVFK
jgi:hypothetical protein